MIIGMISEHEAAQRHLRRYIIQHKHFNPIFEDIDWSAPAAKHNAMEVLRKANGGRMALLLDLESGTSRDHLPLDIARETMEQKRFDPLCIVLGGCNEDVAAVKNSLEQEKLRVGRDGRCSVLVSPLGWPLSGSYRQAVASFDIIAEWSAAFESVDFSPLEPLFECWKRLESLMFKDPADENSYPQFRGVNPIKIGHDLVNINDPDSAVRQLKAFLAVVQEEMAAARDFFSESEYGQMFLPFEPQCILKHYVSPRKRPELKWLASLCLAKVLSKCHLPARWLDSILNCERPEGCLNDFLDPYYLEVFQPRRCWQTLHAVKFFVRKKREKNWSVDAFVDADNLAIYVAVRFPRDPARNASAFAEFIEDCRSGRPPDRPGEKFSQIRAMVSLNNGASQATCAAGSVLPLELTPCTITDAELGFGFRFNLSEHSVGNEEGMING